MKKLFEIIVILVLIAWILFGCRTTRLDHETGDRNPTWNKRHLDWVHKTPWYAGNDLITPVGFKPVKATTVKK